MSATAAALNQYAATAAAVQQQQQQAQQQMQQPSGYAPPLFPSPMQTLLPPPPGSTPQQQADYAAATAAAATAIGLPPSFDPAAVAPPARPKRYFCRRCYPHLHFSSELDKKRHIDEFHDGRARNRVFQPGSAAAVATAATSATIGGDSSASTPFEGGEGELGKRKAGSEGPDTPDGSVNGDVYPPTKKRPRMDLVFSGGEGGGEDESDEQRDLTPAVQEPMPSYCANPPPPNTTPDDVNYDEQGRAFKTRYYRPPAGVTIVSRVYWDEMEGDATMWNRPWGWQSQSANLRRGKDGVYIPPKTRVAPPPPFFSRHNSHSSEPSTMAPPPTPGSANGYGPSESTMPIDPNANGGPPVSRRKSRAQPEKVVVLLDYPCPFCIVEPPCDFDTQTELDVHVGAVHDWRATERAGRERKERRSTAAGKPPVTDEVVVPPEGALAVPAEAPPPLPTSEAVDATAVPDVASLTVEQPARTTDALASAPTSADALTADAPVAKAVDVVVVGGDEEEEVGPCEMCVPSISFGNAAARDWHWKVAHQRLTRPPPGESLALTHVEQVFDCSSTDASSAFLVGPTTPSPEPNVDEPVTTVNVSPATNNAVVTPTQAVYLSTIVSDAPGPGGSITPSAASPLSTSFFPSPSAEHRKPRMSDLLNPTTATTSAPALLTVDPVPVPTPVTVTEPVQQTDGAPPGTAPVALDADVPTSAVIPDAALVGPILAKAPPPAAIEVSAPASLTTSINEDADARVEQLPVG